MLLPAAYKEDVWHCDKTKPCDQAGATPGDENVLLLTIQMMIVQRSQKRCPSGPNRW